MIIGRGGTEHTDEKLTNTQITSFKSDLELMKARKAERIALSGEFIVNSLALALTSFGELDSLELDAAIIENPYGVSPTHSGIWKDIWIRASMVYRFTTSALAKSGTPVGTFGVYRNTHECSVPSYDVTVFPEYLDEVDGFIAFTSSIRNLALKVDAIRSLFPTGSGLEKPGAYGEENFRGVARLLRLMPKLETLHLHLCYAYNGDERLFTAIAEDVHLPSLKKCVLGGIHFHQMTILRFLQRHPHIEHLELIESRLSAGWGPIFEHLSDTSKMPALTHLRLSNLCENGQLENLKPIWEDDISHYSVKEWCSSCLDGTLFHTREFDADDLRKGLVFEPGPEDRPYVLMTPRYSDDRVVIYGVP